jgi:hypothetical protein
MKFCVLDVHFTYYSFLGTQKFKIRIEDPPRRKEIVFIGGAVNIYIFESHRYPHREWTVSFAKLANTWNSKRHEKPLSTFTANWRPS